MTTRTLGYGGALAVALILCMVPIFLTPPGALAQERPGKPEAAKPAEVTLMGRVVDLHGFMTGEYPDADRAKSTAQCISNGVPAALETDKGLVILGQGMIGPAKALAATAYVQAEIRGALHEKDGLKYLDLAEAKVVEKEAQARPKEAQPVTPKDATLFGRVVDLHCFLTGQYPPGDKARCTANCIRLGVPAALETDEGLVILGQGMSGPAKALVPHAYQEIEVKGKLYEKAGVKYLDITAVGGEEKKKVETEEEAE
jgi:hypothetical protein